MLQERANTGVRQQGSPSSAASRDAARGHAHGHGPAWTTIIARVGLSTLLLPALLISSLLSFPTNCACGADLPHVHTIFTMHGHTHTQVGSDAGALPGDPGHPHADEHAPAVSLTVVAAALTVSSAASDDVSSGAATAASVAAERMLTAGATDMDAADTPDMAEMQPLGSTPAVPAVGLLLEATISVVPGPATAVLAPDALVLVGQATTPDAPPPRSTV